MMISPLSVSEFFETAGINEATGSITALISMLRTVMGVNTGKKLIKKALNAKHQ